jgi:hypothetical protein
MATTDKLNKDRMNHENWGKLLKTWVTGDDYFAEAYPGGALPPAGDKYPKPKTLDELVAIATQVQAFNRDALRPDITQVQFLQIETDPTDALVIRLPTTDMIRNVETRIKTTNDGYQLAPFYTTFVNADPTLPSGTDDQLRFHAARIGEYTIQNCQ